MFFWSKKNQTQNNEAVTKAVNDARALLMDISHLSLHCVCALRVAPGEYSTAIDASIRISGAESICGTVVREFECFKSEKVAQAVAGNIEVAQMSREVKAREEEVNQILSAKLLNRNYCGSYPFSNLIEYLKPIGNGDMEIEYPAVILDADMRNQRPACLRILQQKSIENFSNCRVISSNASSVTIEFN